MKRWSILAVGILGVLPPMISGAVAGEEPRLVVSLANEHLVSVFDAAGQRLARIPVGVAPRGMALRDGLLYVANRGLDRAPGSSVTVIDLERLQPVETLLVCEGCAPYDLTFAADGRMWLTGQSHRAVYYLDPPYEHPAGSVMASWGWPTQIASAGSTSDSERMLVGMRGSNDVGVLDTGSRKIEKLTIGPVPGVVFSRPGHAEGWVATNPMGALHAVSGEGPQYTIERLLTPEYLGEAAFLPGGRLVAVTSGDATGLLVYDAEEGKEVGRVILPAKPTLLALTGDGSRAAVALVGEQVAIVDLNEPTAPALLRTIDIGGKPAAMVWAN